MIRPTGETNALASSRRVPIIILGETRTWSSMTGRGGRSVAVARPLSLPRTPVEAPGRVVVFHVENFRTARVRVIGGYVRGDSLCSNSGNIPA
jgi:hypothetical protein